MRLCWIIRLYIGTQDLSFIKSSAIYFQTSIVTPNDNESRFFGKTSRCPGCLVAALLSSEQKVIRPLKGGCQLPQASKKRKTRRYLRENRVTYRFNRASILLSRKPRWPGSPSSRSRLRNILCGTKRGSSFLCLPSMT